MSLKEKQKKTKYLAVSAMLCALGVILLSLGSLIEVLDISVACIASLLCIYAVIEIGGVYPWLIWAVTSVLAMILLPQKTPAVFYACFAGFYPILKEKLEKRPTKVALPVKLLVFHASLLLMYAGMKLFAPAALEGDGYTWIYLAAYAVSFGVFFLYDIALTRLITLYLYRFRNRFKLK